MSENQDDWLVGILVTEPGQSGKGLKVMLKKKETFEMRSANSDLSSFSLKWVEKSFWQKNSHWKMASY